MKTAAPCRPGRRAGLICLAAALSLSISSVRAGQTSPEPAPSPDKGLHETESTPPAPNSAPPKKTDPLAYTPPGSLGDAVRRSQQQKPPAGTEKKKSLGVITNESLRKATPAGGATPSAGKGAKAATPTPAPYRPPAQPYVARDNDGRTEEDWKVLSKGARDRIAKTEERIRNLEAESARLENDFYAWSDGNYRDRVIKPAWDKARDDLKQARTDLDAANLNWENMQEVARKAGAPPGWLR
ncbi:MAG: hypothetical protein IT186_01930 [Acidobacteria bacterium]|nr:hypothetical protein [Acidobacteriota bacterium]MCK6681923.1 hypothetical protein [Thermoanaerobaculia bacterium]